ATVGDASVWYTVSPASRADCTGAFHYRRISTSYTGPTFTLRRGSDDTTADFYADINGELGTAVNGTGTSVQTWGDNSVLYVTRWYDQSGLGNYAEQNTSRLQPVYNCAKKVLDFGSQADAYFTIPSWTIYLRASPYTILLKHRCI